MGDWEKGSGAGTAPNCPAPVQVQGKPPVADVPPNAQDGLELGCSDLQLCKMLLAPAIMH